MSLVIASLGLLLAAGEERGWIAGVQTLARGRAEPSGSGRPESGIGGVGEIELAGRLGLFAKSTAGSASLTYVPQLLLRAGLDGAAAGGNDSTQQGGRLDLGVSLAPSTRLASRTTCDWGLTDFSPLASQGYPVQGTTPVQTGPGPTPIPGGGLLPAQRFAHTLSVGTGLGLEHSFFRGLQLRLGADFQRSGGVGHDAVQVLPIQTLEQATGVLSWTVNHANAGYLRTSVSEARFSTGRSAILSGVQLGWSLLAFRELRLEGGAGTSIARSSVEGGVRMHENYLNGALRVRWDSGRRLGASVGASYAPGIDRVSGLPFQGVSADATLEASFRRLRLLATGARGRVISGAAAGTQNFRLEARASWKVSSAWSAESSLGAAKTNQAVIAGWQYQLAVGLRWAGGGRL